MSREQIKDESLDKVVGGLMNFNYNTNVLKYTHEELHTVTTYEIVDFMAAWQLSNARHADGVHEDQIISELLDKGYIK